MSDVKTFLRGLDEAIQRGTPESRMKALWHTTDLMITGGYSEDEIWTFGEVIGRLADEIEVAARAQLSKQLARFDQAPVNIIHKLAFDDEIEVAGPVLQESERLEPYALIANAESPNLVFAVAAGDHQVGGMPQRLHATSGRPRWIASSNPLRKQILRHSLWQTFTPQSRPPVIWGASIERRRKFSVKVAKKYCF